MAVTKTSRTLLTSQSLAAGASINAAELDLRTAVAGTIVFVKLTNGSSAPTTAPVVTFYSGEATGVKRKRYQAAGDTVANGINEPYFVADQGDMYVNVSIQNGATNSITVECYAQEATSI